jgi:hypothetical protein
LLPRAPIDLMLLPSSEKLNFDAKQRDKYKISGDKGRKQLDFESGDLVLVAFEKRTVS